MKVTRRTLSLLFALGALQVLPKYAAGAAPQADTIRVSAILSLSGAGASAGLSQRNALRLAQESIDKRGGLDGHPIEFMIENDRSLAERATELARDLVARKTPMIIGGSLASTSAAIARVASAAHVVDLAMTPFTPPLARGSFVFQVNASNAPSINSSKSAFEHLYRSEFGGTPNRSAFCGWDTAHLAALAVRRSGGGIEPRALAVALAAMKPYPGVTGTIALSASRPVTTSSTTVAKPNAAGRPLTPVGAE